MRQEFQVHHLNETGMTKAVEIADIFSDCLEEVEKLLPEKCRGKSLVVTKLQEACFFAKREIALDPANCTDEPTP